MSFLKKLFGTNNNDSENLQKTGEPAVAEPLPKKGFSNTIPPASTERLRMQIIDALQSEGVNYSETPEQNEISFRGQLKCDLNSFIMVLKYLPQGIKCYAVPSGSIIPSERIPALVELFTRINSRFCETFFELHREAEVYTCTTFLVNNGEAMATDDIIKSLATIINILEGYGNAIEKTVNGIGSPEINELRAAEILFS